LALAPRSDESGSFSGQGLGNVQGLVTDQDLVGDQGLGTKLLNCFTWNREGRREWVLVCFVS